MTADGIDRSPTWTSATVSILAALAAVALVDAGIGLAFSVPGAVLVGIGAVLGSRRPIDYGTLCLFCGIAVAGIAGAPPQRLVPATLCTLVVWDAGGYGVALGQQLGRNAETRRAEVVHSSLTLGVGASGAVVVYGAYRTVSGGQPAIALTLLLVGVVLLVVAVR